MDSYPEVQTTVDLMKQGDRIEKHWILRNRGIKYGVKIKVCSIKNPSNFWIQVAGSKSLKDMEQLSLKMYCFYTLTCDEYRINPIHSDVGHVCAAKYGDQWYRVIILRILSKDGQDYAGVFFVDVGTIGTVDKRDLFYMPKVFAVLPQQAILARLAFIKSKSKDPDHWSKAAINYFSSITKDRLLDGYVTKVDDDSKLSLMINDTTIPLSEISINDAMLDADYAELVEDPM